MMEPERIIAHHGVARISWLRAVALRMTYGVVSIAALIIGVAAAANSEGEVLVAGLAAVWAGAIALAMAEYISTCTQAENADARPEPRTGVAAGDELVTYHRSGWAEDLAGTAGAGIAGTGSGNSSLADYRRARPIQVAVTSAGNYVLGAAVPLAAASLSGLEAMPLVVGLVSLGTIGVLAVAGVGSGVGRGAMSHSILRATTWGAAAMTATFAVGRIFGTAVV